MGTREIFVPNAAAVRQARHVMATPDWEAAAGATLVKFHPAYCHMQPWVVAALAAWALELERNGGSVRVENGEQAVYAWRFGLADYFGIDPPVEVHEHEEAGRFIPLRTIKPGENLAELLTSLVTLLHVVDNAAEAVLYAMSEMVRNTLEHSRSPYGAVVCAQRYPGSKAKPGYVSIGIADTGVGVLESLSGNYTVESSAEALLKAIEPGVTGAIKGMYGSSDNAGAGLFVTRHLSQETGRYFAIASGDALFRSSAAQHPPPDEDLAIDIAPYPGTIVCVEVGLSDAFDYSDILRKAWSVLGRGDIQVAEEDSSERVIFT